MKHPHDPQVLKRIALATLRPCPRIRRSRVYVEDATGKVSSTGGACPLVPFHTEDRGFVYMDERTGCTYGKAYPTEAAARLHWQISTLRNAVKFLRQLRAMTQKEVHFQRSFYLKDIAAPRKLPGFAA